MIPIVAIVGRPNVGKSTLFNRLVGESAAIVHDAPGVTRDRHYRDAHVHGRDVTIVDTGGFDPTTDDPLGAGISRNAEAAIQEADVIVCVLESAGATAADRHAVDLLRRADKPVLFVANKCDNDRQRLEAAELYSLGLSDLFPISALHGRGMAEFEAALTAALPPPVAPPQAPTEGLPRFALIGRPNAGKSSLFNRLAGKERSLVHDQPGTTVDPVDEIIDYKGRRVLLLDTAGVRRKTKVGQGIESAGVLRSLRVLGRAEVVVLLCDVTEGIADQDARLLSLATARGRGIVVGLNKIDRVAPAEVPRVTQAARDALHFAPWLRPIPISALEGTGVNKLMTAAFDAHASFHKRVSTAELNRFFQQVLERNPPPTQGGRAPRLYYITQAETAPPVFIVMSNAPDSIRDSYARFVANQIRRTFEFGSLPITVRFRQRSRRETR